VAAGAAVGVVMVVPLAAVIIRALGSGATQPTATASSGAPTSFFSALLPWAWDWTSGWTLVGAFGFIVALVIAIAHAREKYRQGLFDPTVGLKFQERFDGMERVFALAARSIRDHRTALTQIDALRGELAPIDPVFDFFDDIGFYVSGDQISPEVAHHHFFHWIRGYCEAARPYLDEHRKREPARWRHVLPLYGVTQEVERAVEKRLRVPGGRQQDLDAFLEDEAFMEDEDGDSSE
jgi:hypothetical protein